MEGFIVRLTAATSFGPSSRGSGKNTGTLAGSIGGYGGRAADASTCERLDHGVRAESLQQRCAARGAV
jgi:hypothetical protein